MDRHHYWDLFECRWQEYRAADTGAPLPPLPVPREEAPADARPAEAAGQPAGSSGVSSR